MPKPHTPKYLPKDHLTLFLPLLFRFLLVVSKSSQEQNPTAHSTNTGSLCSQNLSRIQGKYKTGREAACLKKERPDPAQVPALSGGRERSMSVAGRDPYPSDSAVVLAQPKGQSRGQNEEPRVE